MKNSEKLKIILQLSGYSQNTLARELWVSFPTLNSWLHEKSQPRKKAVERIDVYYLNITGQNRISDSEIQAKKDIVVLKSNDYPSVLNYIVSRQDIYEQMIVSLTYNTNSIEGSTLSENETAQILLENRTVASKTLVEQLEAKNHQSALVYLFKYLQRDNNQINEMLILKLHSILMNSIQSDAGCYRQHGVRILGSEVITANYLKVADLMKQLSQDIEWNIDDIIQHASYVHAQFEKIHPFSDGNGRVGRLLLHAMLLKYNLPPAHIKQETKQKYYTVLARAQTKQDTSLLEDFILDSIINSFKVFN